MLAGVVLAAGSSSRLGSPKALAVLDGETFVARAIAALRDGGCDAISVVVAPPHAEIIEGELSGVAVLHNPNPERGMLSSLKIGLSFAAREPELEAVLFSLIDHPRVRARTVQELVATSRAAPCRALRPLFGGRGGHPVLLSPEAIRDLLAAPDTASPRDVLGRITDLPVDDPGVVDDVDVPADLAALESERR